MSSSNSDNSKNRIVGKGVQFGESYVLPIEQSKVTQSQAKVKKMLEETENKANTIVGNAENKSQIIVQTANTEASRIIDEARKKGQNEYEVVKQQAYDDGFAKGREDGLQKFTEDAQAGLEALETLASSTFEIKKQIIDSAERDIIELVVAIAKKVCCNQLNPQMLYQMTHEAIKMLDEKESITIIVSPKLVEYIRSMIPNIRSSIQGLQSLKIKEDFSLSPDGVIVETPKTRLDARISSQLEELAKKLTNGESNGMG